MMGMPAMPARDGTKPLTCAMICYRDGRGRTRRFPWPYPAAFMMRLREQFRASAHLGPLETANTWEALRWVRKYPTLHAASSLTQLRAAIGCARSAVWVE